MQDAQATVEQTPRFYAMRHDTLLGPCQALGDELGFNPTLLRIALCASLFWSPAIVVGAYAAAAVFVALVDWLFPKPQPQVAVRATEQPLIAQPAAESAAVEQDREREPELVAA